MRVCIIPARGGSKRIPRKNIKDFLGKPIIAYSIEVAKKSCLFDYIIVSTEDDEIAEIAGQYGAITPFMRSKELADDFTGTIPVVCNAIIECEKIFGALDTACCIYPTAPLLKVEYLIQAAQKLEQDNKWQFVFSATEFEYPIFRSFRLCDDKVNMFWPENFEKRSQDLPHAFYDAGQFYFGKKHAFLDEKMIFAEHSTIIKLPRYLVQDIDTQEDWLRLELLYKLINKC